MKISAMLIRINPFPLMNALFYLHIFEFQLFPIRISYSNVQNLHQIETGNPAFVETYQSLYSICSISSHEELIPEFKNAFLECTTFIN